MKQIQLLILFIFLGLNLEAGSLSGHVRDSINNEPILICTVALYKDGVLITGTETDFDGNYFINGIKKGEYLIEVSYVGYRSSRVDCVTIGEGKTVVDIPLCEGYFNSDFMFLCCHSCCEVERRKMKPEVENFAKGAKGATLLNYWPYRIEGREERGCNQTAKLTGSVKLWDPIDSVAVDPAVYATAVLYKKGKLISIQECDLDGEFEIENLEMGNYVLKINYVGHKEVVVEEIEIVSTLYKVSIELEPYKSISEEILISGYRVPLIEKYFSCGGPMINQIAKADSNSIVFNKSEVNISVNKAYSVFPNPANSVLQVDMSADYDQLRLYSVHGARTHLDKELHSGLNRFDISTLVSGQYVLLFYKQGALMDTELVQVVQD